MPAESRQVFFCKHLGAASSRQGSDTICSMRGGLAWGRAWAGGKLRVTAEVGAVRRVEEGE